METQDAGSACATRIAKGLGWKVKELASMKDEDSEDLDARALSTIHLCLEDEVLFNITEERQHQVCGPNWRVCI
jgi:hypothetical protein